MSTNLKFQLPYIPQKVVVIGCGGTGSRLIPPLAQLMSTLQTLISPEMVLVDFDIVEEKNLSRQNFAKADVGKNKAEVLAARYSKAFGLKITPITVAAGTTEFDEALNMFNLREGLAGPSLYVLAVDSANARRQVLSSALMAQVNQPNSSVVIDAGNEDIFGQVSFFTTGKIGPNAAKDLEFIYNWHQGFIPGELSLTELPIDIPYYANMVDGESTRSCADLDQTLAINNMMASQVVAYAQNFLMGKPCRTWRTNFDLFNGVGHDNIEVKEVLRRAAPIRDGASREVRMFRDSIQRGMYANALSMDSVLTELASSLESEMLSENPVRWNTAKMISETLNEPKFVPSMFFAPDYPEHYKPEFVEMWNTGFVIPEPTEENKRTYEIALSIFNEMQKEASERLAAQAAVPVMAPTADDEDEEEEDDN